MILLRVLRESDRLRGRMSDFESPTTSIPTGPDESEDPESAPSLPATTLAAQAVPRSENELQQLRESGGRAGSSGTVSQ